MDYQCLIEPLNGPRGVGCVEFLPPIVRKRVRGHALSGAVAERLFGAAPAQSNSDVGSPPAPNERPGFDRLVAAVQEAIGDEGAFARAWAEGRAMSLEQAIDVALDTAVQPTTNADGWAS